MKVQDIALSFRTQEGICIRCFQKISNPICDKCYTNHLKLWLTDHKISPKQKKKILSTVMQRFSAESETETPCILCGRPVSFCTYCYFFNVKRILLKNGINKQALMTFPEI